MVGQNFYIALWVFLEPVATKTPLQVRNKEMAEYAEALIALYTKNSKGTLNMIEQAKKNKLLIYSEAI